jgi:hypothetical protein
MSMSNPYSTFCDDFYVNMRLGSQMPLPHQRETVLHFCEQMQKAFPSMVRFRKGEGHDYSLEEEKTTNSYRWINIEASRLSAGHVNPGDVDNALKLHTLVAELIPYELSISPLEIDYLDVLFGFDLNFSGNHDEVVAESLFENQPMACLLDLEGARAIDFQPSTTISLSDDLRLQARVDIITRTNSYQVRTGDYNDDAISVYLILRRFWGDRPKTPVKDMVVELARRAEQLAASHVLPHVVRRINAAIASRS